MMVQRNSQMFADDRKSCRPQFPRVARHADRAAKLVPWQMDAGMFAARAQHPGIERCVVRDQEVRPVQQAPQFGPKFAKGRAVADIVPGQSMDVRENEPLSRWPDEPMVPFHNSIILDMHDTDRASAVGMVVCRFEINCCEICHRPRAIAPSQVTVTMGGAIRIARRLRACGLVSLRNLRDPWARFGRSRFAMSGRLDSTGRSTWLISIARFGVDAIDEGTRQFGARHFLRGAMESASNARNRRGEETDAQRRLVRPDIRQAVAGVGICGHGRTIAPDTTGRNMTPSTRFCP